MGLGEEEPSESVGKTKTAKEEMITDRMAREAEHPKLTPKTPTESIGSIAEITKGNGPVSPSRLIGSPLSPSPDGGTSNSAVKKGYGLKNWRRIKRDMRKEVPAPPDFTAILKGRLSVQESSKNRDDNKHKIDAAEGEALVASNSAAPTAATVAAGGLDPELGLLASSGGFSVGVNSDNSDERSSESSTTASAPRLRHEVAGFGWERRRGKGAGGGAEWIWRGRWRQNFDPR